MKTIKRWFLIALLLLSNSACFCSNIGLLIVATGKYIDFVPSLIQSAHTHFCTNHEVTFFVFTDGAIEGDHIVRIQQERLGWPHDTLMRISMYDKHKEEYKKMDYLFALDADMRFENTVGDEILSDLVATQHPGYVGRRGTYETRRASTAWVSGTEGSHYFAGGFNGGSRKEFLKMVRTLTKNIQADLNKGMIAIWHDESHINRYFASHPPTKILSPEYCYPEGDTHYKRTIWKQPYTRRLVALDKKHDQLRK